MSKILVIGGGASGMLAAICAAARGHEVHIIEKNEKFGKKIYITGKGRCNVTNDSPVEEMLQKVIRNDKFLYSAFYSFSSDMVMEFFENAGCRLKVERGNRVFPVSDHASDIIFTLVSLMGKYHVHQHLNTEVKSLVLERKTVTGVVLKDGSTMKADKIIVATGGLSYPSTGSTGDGYRFADKAGHTITDTMPSLVPFNVKEEYVKDLQGRGLKNADLRIITGNNIIYQDFGEMIFTHFGVSGPLILSGSSYLGEYLCKNPSVKNDDIKIVIDLKPALDSQQLDARLLREFEENKNKNIKNIFPHLLPSKMHNVFLKYAGIDGEKKINEITKEERARLVYCFKNFTMTFNGFRSYNEAVITKGGVSVKEINPSSMESKLCRNLFFVGEVLDLDALTGGYNLQIAWSTGFLAGNSV